MSSEHRLNSDCRVATTLVRTSNSAKNSTPEPGSRDISRAFAVSSEDSPHASSLPLKYAAANAVTGKGSAGEATDPCRFRNPMRVWQHKPK